MTPIERDGGWGEIRTRETLAGLPVFKTGAFNRSATHPRDISYSEQTFRPKQTNCSPPSVAFY